MNLKVRLRKLHPEQQKIAASSAKRRVIRAGRRAGKTTVAADLAVNGLMDERRVLYAVPTQEQVERFWYECKRALAEPIDAGVLYKNETRHVIEVPGTEQRIRAKTAWDADTLRGDYADLLILDEFQLMKPDAWRLVGAPMLLDNDGDAVFIYTPRRGSYYAKELYNKAKEDRSGRWGVFHFSSHANPYISREALGEITDDLTALAHRLEIKAEEVEDDPSALWNRSIIEHVTRHPPLVRIAVGVDPPGTASGAECGIIAAGVAQVNGEVHGYVLDDRSLRGSPAQWGAEAVTAYYLHDADRLAAEVNHGGDMVEHTIRTVEDGKDVAFRSLRASRGKHTRAEPVAALYERGRVHHVGEFSELEDQLCNWVPGDKSPDRLDALVWVLTELMIQPAKQKRIVRGFAAV